MSVAAAAIAATATATGGVVVVVIGIFYWSIQVKLQPCTPCLYFITEKCANYEQK